MVRKKGNVHLKTFIRNVSFSLRQNHFEITTNIFFLCFKISAELKIHKTKNQNEIFKKSDNGRRHEITKRQTDFAF